MNFFPQFYVTLLAIVGALSLIMLCYAFMLRHRPGAVPFGGLMAAGIVWTVGYAAEIIVQDHAAKLFWLNVKQIGMVFTPVFYFWGTLEFSRQARVRDRRLLLLLIVPLVSGLLVFALPVHPLIRQEVEFVAYNNVTLVRTVPGLWVLVSGTHGLALTAASLIVCLNALRSANMTLRRQSRALIAAFLLPVAGILADYAGLNPLRPFSVIVFMVLPSNAILLWALFKQGLFDVVPFARARVMDVVADGIFVTDLDGRIVDYNPPAEAALKHFSGEDRRFQGALVRDVFAKHPEFARYFSEAGETRREVGVQTASGMVHYEIRIRPIMDAQSERAGYLTVLHEITNRKRIENQLRESERHYRLLADNAQDVIWTMNLEGRFTYVSPSVERLCGYTVSEVMQQGITDALTPESAQIALDGLKAAFEQLEQYGRIFGGTFELEQPRKDGTTVWTEATVNGLYDEQGQFVGLLGVSRNISERKQAERRLIELAMDRERLRVLEDFIRDASHDLKTPITALQAASYVQQRLIERLRERLHLSDEPDSGNGKDPESAMLRELIDKMQERVETAAQSSERLGRIVTNMLEIARLERWNTIQRALTDVSALAEHLVRGLMTQFAQKGLRLTMEAELNLPPVSVDVIEFTRALHNLLDNAQQYTPSGGAVAVRTRHAPKGVYLEVSDTGIGIDPADLPRIFDRFYRADRARSVHTGGAGLGLAIVKRIIEGLDGAIEVESEVGRGTTFRIFLPRSSHALLSDLPPFSSLAGAAAERKDIIPETPSLS